MTPRTEAGQRLSRRFRYVNLPAILAIEDEAARDALVALRAEVVKLDDLRRDVQTAEAMNHHVLALIDAALS